MFLNLLKCSKIVKAGNGNAAAQTLVTSSTVLMDGYDSVMCIVDLAAVVDGAVMTLQAQDGALANGSDAANIAGAATAAFTGATSSNGQIVLDLQKPLKEYVTFTFARTAQNVTVNSITMILYNARNKPTVQPTTVLSSAEINSAA